MLTLPILLVLSLSGICFIVWRRLKIVRTMPRGEFIASLDSTKSLFFDLYKSIETPVKDYYRNVFLPAFYKRAEKTVAWFRINVLRMEHKLLSFKNYLRGKHIIQTNGNTSPYWDEMKEFKNNLNPEEKD